MSQAVILFKSSRVLNERAPDAPNTGFEIYQERRPAGLVGRFFITLGQLLGLLFGAANVYVHQQRAKGQANSLLVLFLRVWLFFVRPFLDKRTDQLPFPVQFRLRLERLGPTYIKLGQILSLREDLLTEIHHRRTQEPPRPTPRRHVRALSRN